MNYKKFFKSNIFVFIFFLLTIYGVFRISDSFDKGYNIYEDNILIQTDQKLDSTSVIDVGESMIKVDFESWKRFRPMWVIYMIFIIEVFGFNLMLINIFVALLCIITTFLLFRFCRNSEFSYLQSIVFSLMTVIGPATILWVRIIDQEIIGMLFLSFTLYFLSKSIFEEKNNKIFKLFFTVSLFLTALSKESFLITVPAILFLYLWFYKIKNNTNLLDSLKKNYILIIVSSLFSLSLLIFAYIIGSKNYENNYSGIDFKLFTLSSIWDFIVILFSNKIFLTSILGITILLLNEFFNKNIPNKNYKKHLLQISMLLFFMFLLIVPQFIIYYKTGFTERYFLPFLVGFSFSLVYIIKLIFDNNYLNVFLKYSFFSVVILLICFELITVTIPSLSKYSQECKSTTKVAQLLKNNPSRNLLVVIDPVQNYWEAYKLKIYLDYINAQEDYKYDLIKRDFVHKYYNDTAYYNKSLKLNLEKLGNSIIDSTNNNYNFDEILVFWSLDKKFIEKNKDWFNESDYKKNQLNNYTLYIKKNN